MDRSHELNEMTEEILAFGPRLPGEGGAMAYMDTVADLVLLYRDLHSPARPPMQTAASVLGRVRHRLPDEVAGRLAYAAEMAVRTGQTPDVSLPPGLAEAVLSGPEGWLMDGWRTWAEPAQGSLLALGLVGWERMLTRDAYELRYHSGDAYQARFLVLVGWLPSVVAAIVAGIAVAVLLGSLWPILLIAPTGAVLGCLVTLAAYVSISWTEERWRWLGERWWTAFVLVVLVTGPIAVLLEAILVVNLASS